MDELGTLKIKIWVRWQDQMKPITVLTKSVERNKAREMAMKFFEQNPCCGQLDPEIIWTLEERINARDLPVRVKNNAVK